jgi:NAD(P)-dependent dehydrogenase (short-subunit alcohol dehydrogenase family)
MSRNDELVAVVTGGSRDIGKGVARALAERGARVYVAGRSQAGGIHTAPGGARLPGTIQEAAEEVSSLGGRGVAVACDLSVDEDIRSLFERVRQESGHLNILVNNAAYLNEKMVVKPFWEAPER